MLGNVSVKLSQKEFVETYLCVLQFLIFQNYLLAVNHKTTLIELLDIKNGFWSNVGIRIV